MRENNNILQKSDKNKSGKIRLRAKDILIIVIVFHCFNSLWWFINDGYFQHGCHSVWLENKAFKETDIWRDKEIPTGRKILETLDFFKLSHSGYHFAAANFNLSTLFLSFPIAADLNGHIKLWLINVILFLQFLLVIMAVYYLGKNLVNEEIGAWAAVIFSFYPGIIGLSRKVNIELLVMFFVILSVIIFMHWKIIPRILRTGLLFLVFCMGVLSGGLFLVFFIPLFLLHILTIIFNREKRIGNCFEMLIFLFLCFFFFNFYFNGEYHKVFTTLKAGFDEAYQKITFQSVDFIGSADNAVIESFLLAPQDSFCPCTQTTNVGANIKTFSFYIMELIYYLSPLFFGLAFLSLFFFFKKKNINFLNKTFMATWIVSGYLLLSLFHIKWGKFITPLLPVLAVTSSIFICEGFKNIKFKKIVVLALGILTVIYYSYVPFPRKRFLEKLNEGVISHRPMVSNFIKTAEDIGKIINSENIDDKMINIAFLDKDSSRFEEKFWVSDMTMREILLIRLFLKGNYQAEIFWKLSDDFYEWLAELDYIVLVTSLNPQNLDDYLAYRPKGLKPLKVELIYKQALALDTSIYLIRVTSLSLVK